MDMPSGLGLGGEAAAISIRQLRSRLLDLTARNPLVSFPHSRSRGSRAHVRAVDGGVDVLFNHVREGKQLDVRPLPPSQDEPEDERTLRFAAALETARLTDGAHATDLAGLSVDELASAKAEAIERKLRDRVRLSLGLPPSKAVVASGLADHAARAGIDPSFELRPTLERAPRRQARSTEFQALVLPDPLERQLAKIRDTARTVAEETGVSTLHLAFGFLEWFESDASDRPITSPLILMRVDIDRRIIRSRYQYSLCAVGDEAEVNLTLSERLDRDFRIKLPELGEDETPEAYLERVLAEVCSGRARWAVRRFVTLAHFPFARLSMFQDLDEAQWPEGLASHAVLGPLLGGKDAGPSLFAEEHDVDSPSVSAKVPVLVLDADASQHSAVYDVMCGKDLVIEGPPGTGKSQTITNIVAAAMSGGKRVLFVADKQAALQVVKDRLDNVGLGEFCLELHSGKARKTDVLDSLKMRLERHPGSTGAGNLEESLRELEATRAALTRYVDVLNERFGALGLTVHDILWADRRRRDGEGAEARRLDEVDVAGCEMLSRAEVEARHSVLDRFERAASQAMAACGDLATHPWRGVGRADLPSVDMEAAVRDMADAANAMAEVNRCAEPLAGIGITGASLLEDLGPVARALATLEVEPGIPDAFAAAFVADAARAAAVEWRAACDRYRRATENQNEQLALPAGSTAGEAARRLAEASIPVLDAAPAGMTVAGLMRWADELRSTSEMLSGLAEAARAASAALGIDPVDDIAALMSVVSAVALAADLPQSALQRVTPDLLSAEGAETVRAAHAAIERARARQATLEAEYSLPPSLDPAVLRKHAATLAAAGPFGFLSPAVKAAKLCFASLPRTPRKSAKTVMAVAMVGLAEHLEALPAIASDEACRSVLGTACRGLATDMDPFLDAVAWASRVRSALPGAGGIDTSTSAALLSGDRNRLAAIRAFAAGPDFARMRDNLSGLSPSSRSASELSAECAGKAEAARALAGVCAGLGLPGESGLERLPAICSLLGATATAEVGAGIPASLEAALGEACPAPLGDHAPLESALRLAEALDRLPVSPSARQALRTITPEELRTATVPSAIALAAALNAALARWASVREMLGLDESRLLGRPMRHATAGMAQGAMTAAMAHADELGGWILYLRERQAAETLGHSALLRLWDERAVRTPLVNAFDRVFHRALARAAFRRHPDLDRFTGLSQEGARARFATLDAQATQLRRRRLAEELGRRPVPAGIGAGKSGDRTETGLILHEIGKRTRHLPIRQLLDRAGQAAQALKPCFMMSPLSVAQYLKPGRLQFDLLVIDEASQMRPEDAVGAVARCGQVVVVGDPKQLPPTSFFARADGSDDDAEDGQDEVDAESILDLAQGVFRPMRRLRWHYRSRHGSLIAFSNKEFYDGDLMVFPSPAEADDGQGVASVKVDGAYAASGNLAEVAAVCAAAVEHMRRRPDRSLGIATMNQVQRELISLEMDRLATAHPEVEAYRERWGDTLERFFVKNLENVQGDERDFIFISTVYGPATPGGKVRQTFGPINGASGHRRLNVLFTRAKHHVRLFTSMEPDDIIAGPESPRGARVLKTYLAYAKSGRLEAGEETGREADSDFEVFVRDRLRVAGYDAVPQVGVAGYFIDLAVRDPASPATFLLGIECDGASYHSSRSARDRDILRQRVLEGLGWTIYRIWSTDWFRDPEGQSKKLTAFIRACTAHGGSRHAK